MIVIKCLRKRPIQLFSGDDGLTLTQVKFSISYQQSMLVPLLFNAVVTHTL